MKRKICIRYLILAIIIALNLLIPENIVWGGNSFQTVPTLGPTITFTRTPFVTQTRPNSTQIPASTVTFSGSSTPLVSITPTSKKTDPIASSTLESQPTKTTFITDLATEMNETSVVIPPVISTSDESPKEHSTEEEVTTIPAFIFPLLVVLLFVVIYLVARLSIKLKINNKK